MDQQPHEEEDRDSGCCAQNREKPENEEKADRDSGCCAQNEEKPKEEIVLQVSQKKKRNISEETREVMRERAKKALETRKKNLEIRKELGLHPHDPLPSKYKKKPPEKPKANGPLPDEERILTKGENVEELRADSLQAKKARRPCNIQEENKILKKQNKEYMLRDIVRSEFENCFERRRIEKEWARESVTRKAKNTEQENQEKRENTEKPDRDSGCCAQKKEKKKTTFKFADGTSIEI